MTLRYNIFSKAKLFTVLRMTKNEMFNGKKLSLNDIMAYIRKALICHAIKHLALF